jgi:hypothetical protein
MKGIRLFLLFSIFCFLSGCSGLKEVARGFTGVSTKILEDKCGEAIKKDFSGDLATIHKKIKDILRIEGAYIYRDDLARNLIALYLSDTDTTPVGVFLTEVDKGNTRIEVSSPSTYAKEVIADIIFSSLSGTRKPKIEKGKLDAKK